MPKLSFYYCVFVLVRREAHFKHHAKSSDSSVIWTGSQFSKNRTYFALQFVDGVGDHSVRLYENSLPHKKMNIIQ